MAIPHARVSLMSREEMRKEEHIHGGAGSILLAGLFYEEEFQTPWFFLHTAILLPGGGIGHHRHDDCEEIFITIDNASQFTHNGRTAEVVGGAAVPVRVGETHAIYNHTDQETRWYNLKVIDPEGQWKSTDLGDDRVGVPLESRDRLPVGRFDRGLLQYGQSHEGKGEIGSRGIWGPQDFRTNIYAVNHGVLPPDSSIGYHWHETIGECYVIMNGRGRMTVDDETFEVLSSDVVLNHLGKRHGIYNHTEEDLEVFTVSVSMKKGEYDCTEVGDDLSKR